MALQQITVQIVDSAGKGGQHLTQRVTLDQVEFVLDTYVTRIVDVTSGEITTRWYMDLADVNGTPIVMGIGLVAGIDLLFPYRAYHVPAGKLFVFSQTQGDQLYFTDPEINTFIEDEATLQYQPVADVEALGLSEES